MIAKMSKRIAVFFANKSIIRKDYVDIYAYGYEILISEIIRWLIIAAIALYSGNILPTILYMLVFIILRHNTGGYHAKTHFRCTLIFTIVYITFLFILKTLPVYFYDAVISLTLAANMILIWKFAPVDSENKPFTISEVSKYRERSLLLTILFTFICMLCFLFDYTAVKQLALCISLASVSVGSSVMVAFLCKTYKKA